MRDSQKPTLAQMLNERLRGYSVGTGFILAALFGLLASGVFFYLQARHQEAMLRAIKQNVAALAQNRDHREIERVLNSFMEAMPNGSSIVLVRDGMVQMSLPDMQEALLPYRPAKLRAIGNILIGSDAKLYSSVNLEESFSHTNFGELVLGVPMRGPLWKAMVAFQIAFAAVGLLLILWRRLTEKTLAEALGPLQDLQDDLLDVGLGSAPHMKPEDFKIKELADMSALLQKQHRDVTTLTQVAAKAEGERGAKEAVRSLMHDLLNPYTALSNLIQTWMLYPDDTEVRDQLREDWPELNRQIKDLLKAARHSEVERLAMQELCLLETASEGARLGSVKNPDAIRIGRKIADVDAAGPWIIAHDRALLSRAVANLVRNSVEEGSSIVEVWCERSPLAIHIRDNGPGIPENKLCELFEGRMKSQKPDGSGIGFPTALRLIRLHGGRIILEKNETKSSGTHFRIDLKALEAET